MSCTVVVDTPTTQEDTTMPPREHPVGLMEIAVMFDVDSATPTRWNYRKMLPEPDFTLSGKPAWYQTTIRRWAKEKGRTIVNPRPGEQPDGDTVVAPEGERSGEPAGELDASATTADAAS